MLLSLDGGLFQADDFQSVGTTGVAPAWTLGKENEALLDAMGHPGGTNRLEIIRLEQPAIH